MLNADFATGLRTTLNRLIAWEAVCVTPEIDRFCYQRLLGFQTDDGWSELGWLFEVTEMVELGGIEPPTSTMPL